jgi:pimeloyl-ACP methyl ester carboxylesterase
MATGKKDGDREADQASSYSASATAVPSKDFGRWQLHRVRIDGSELSYVDQGEGRAVVFVHGGMSDHRCWDAHRPSIALRYRVIAPTLRYFGSSPWADDGRHFSMQVHADDLAAFIGALRLGPVAMVGRSYGAAVVLVMAVRHPSLVERLFLYEPGLATFVTDPADAARAADDRRQAFNAAKAAVDEGDIDRAVELLMDAADGRVGAFRQLPDQIRGVMLENGRILPLLFASPAPSITCADLGRLGIPVSLVVGEQSRVFYRIAAEAAHRCIAGSRLIEVPNARHLWPSQEPAAFGQLVLDFLDRE